MSETLVVTEKLIKRFGDFEAVSGVDLQIRKGECFGLLGPNGAGKSTLIGMLYGVVERTSGELRVFGKDPATEGRSIKARLGVVTQDNALDESLTVRENMLIYSAFVGVPRLEREKRVDELLEYMQLGHKQDAMIRFLSGGMKRRLVFVRALLSKPELLILDEPTTGLDPAVRHLLWGKVRELKANGTTILLTTHYMHEAEILCDRISVMNKGLVVAEGTPNQLINSSVPGYVAVFETELGAKRDSLVKIASDSPGFSFSEDSSGFFLRAPSLEVLVDVQTRTNIQAVQIRPANLEDVFLKITGRELASND